MNQIQLISGESSLSCPPSWAWSWKKSGQLETCPEEGIRHLKDAYNIHISIITNIMSNWHSKKHLWAERNYAINMGFLRRAKSWCGALNRQNYDAHTPADHAICFDVCGVVSVCDHACWVGSFGVSKVQLVLPTLKSRHPNCFHSSSTKLSGFHMGMRIVTGRRVTKSQGLNSRVAEQKAASRCHCWLGQLCYAIRLTAMLHMISAAWFSANI